MPPWSLTVTVLASSLALTACGGDGGGSPSLPTSQQTNGEKQEADRDGAGGSSSSLMPTQEETFPLGAPLVSDQHFHYNLTRAGEAPITQTVSRQLVWTTSDLRQLDGTEGTESRDDFNTVDGSLADNSTFTRYGFRGQYGYAAIVLGEESRQITDTGRTWSGPFQTAHAWAAGGDHRRQPHRHGQRHLARHCRGSQHCRLPTPHRHRQPDHCRPVAATAHGRDRSG